MMEIKATYEKTLFLNKETRYCVVVMKSNDPNVPDGARKKFAYRDGLVRFTATGVGLPLTAAIELTLDGTWEENKYGQQLKVGYWRENVPLTVEGIKGYLASGLIKGIGKATAESVVNRFGTNALTTLEHQPERYLEIPGITESKLAEIKESYASSRVLSDLMAFLAPFEITPNAAKKIHDQFGAESIEVVKNRPFELCCITGFGFIKVDEIARKIGCPPNDPLRIQNALLYVLSECGGGEGHLFLKHDELCKRALGILNHKLPDECKLERQAVADALYHTVVAGKLVASEEAMYLPANYANEDKAAANIIRLLAYPVNRRDISQVLKSVVTKLNITLLPKQEEGVRAAFQSNFSIITGSPGTGKTTVLKTVIEVFRGIRPDGKIMLAAPTGRASRRMAESTGFKEAKTLHKALGLMGGDDVKFLNKSDPIEADLLILDEFSMVDMWLANTLFSRLQKGTKILLTGDADQLPSVGAGNVFRELIDCGLIPVTTLNEIFRQSKDSLIAHNARHINMGRTKLIHDNDFRMIEVKTDDEAAMRICQIYLDEIKHEGIANVQILSPMNERGNASVDKLNAAIREHVNPASANVPELAHGNRVFRLNDRVIQTKNKGEVSNGDVGFVKRVHDGKVMIDFGDNRVVEYDYTGLANVELAYAITVHKAMGSEYNTVILPILSTHSIMLYRNLLYTAVTRAKSRVILVGQRGTLMTIIHKNRDGKRNTMLAERIRQYARELVQKQKEVA
jgi:exodeoxyribonuclease V alpha subunit